MFRHRSIFCGTGQLATLLALLMMLCVTPAAKAQQPGSYTPQLLTYAGAPTGICDTYQVSLNVSNGAFYSCSPTTRTWVAAANPGGNFTFTGLDIFTQLLTLNSGLTIAGGATLMTTNQTGTGNLVLATSPTLSGSPVISGNLTATAGQNIITTYNLDNIIFVDGTKYALNSAGLSAACTAAGSSGTVYVTSPIVMTANVTCASGVALAFLSPGNITTTGWTLTINGPVVAPPIQIFAGSGTIALGAQANPIRAVWFPGADILAQIGNAYAAEQSSGGTILLDPQSSGACWSANSTANLNTLGKYVTVQGTVPPADSNGQVTTGSCILYTRVSANTAFVIDWTPAAGGGYMPGAGLRDLAIINSTTEGGSNECRTAGGCSSSATGINIGPVNGGAHAAEFTNLIVEGFGTNINVPDAASVSWGMVFRNVSLVYGTTGYSQAKGEELGVFIESKIALNGTGLKFLAGSGDISFVSGHVDSNTTCGVDTTASSNEISFYGTHWENLNVAGNVCYVKGGSATINIYGGLALNDNSSGASSAWFTASTFEVHGLTLFSSGATLASRVFTVNGQADISVFDNSTTPIPLANVVFASTGVKFSVISAGNAPYVSGVATVEYCGATSGATQACAKTVQTLPVIVWGDVLLNGAVSQSITTLPFTDTLYSCTGSDLTTSAGVVAFNTYASASVTIVETGGTNADHLRYVCAGH